MRVLSTICWMIYTRRVVTFVIWNFHFANNSHVGSCIRAMVWRLGTSLAHNPIKNHIIDDSDVCTHTWGWHRYSSMSNIAREEVCASLQDIFGLHYLGLNGTIGNCRISSMRFFGLGTKSHLRFGYSLGDLCRSDWRNLIDLS